MKKITYLVLFISAIVFQSCDVDKVDDDFYGDVKVYSEFTTTTLSLPVLEGEANTASVAVKISTPTNTSGLSINVLPKSDGVEGTDFTLDTSDLNFTDGKIEGNLLIQGIFEAATLDGKSVFLELQSTDENVVVQGNTVIEVRIEKQCPVPSDYLVGEYTISDVQGTVGPNNGTVNFGGTVTIEVGSAPTQRVFNSAVLPAFGRSAEVKLSLVCNNIGLSEPVLPQPGLSCNQVDLYIFTPAETTSYDVSDDESFIINYVEDPNGACGGPYEASFRLTKV